jgi:hypothetical protein
MSSFKIPVIVFFITLVASTVLIVTLAKAYDKDKELVNVGSKSLPPFPDVAPLVAAPVVVDPTTTNLCVSLVGDETGGYVPSPMDPLTQCSSNSDCDTCVTSPIEIPLECKEPTSEISQQQTNLGNSGSKFCLPKTSACLTQETLLACTHDADCASCSDEVGNGAALQCQIVTKPKKISLLDTDGEPLTDEQLAAMNEEDVLEVPSGQWCLPKTGECDNENGVLHWTTAGWSCTCRFPAIHGGDNCSIFKACNNPLTTEWSAGNQQLLVNEDSPDPQVWTMDSGINPMLCHVEGVTNKAEWDKTCGVDTIPNVVCQCDGLMLESRMGFRNEPTNPLTCTPDSCSVNALGGRATEPLTMMDWSPNDPNVPPNQCVCSGADARIWDIDTRDPSEVEKTDPVLAETLRLQQGHVYTGRCRDTTIATNGSRVVLKANPDHANSDACSLANNQHAEVTSLVPGFAVDEAGNAEVSVCSADPCRAHYSDVNFRPPEDIQNWGHYSTENGACECVSPSKSTTIESDDLTVNPVASVCANACSGMESDNPDDWPCKLKLDPNRPCKQDPNRQCPEKAQCLTGENGEAVCVCPEGWGNIDGNTCVEKFDNFTSCHGYAGMPNVCNDDEDGNPSRCVCHRGRSRDDILSSCENTDEWYSMCTTSLWENPTCHVGDDRGLSLCGGSINFKCEGTPGCNKSAPVKDGCPVPFGDLNYKYFIMVPDWNYNLIVPTTLSLSLTEPQTETRKVYESIKRWDGSRPDYQLILEENPAEGTFKITADSTAGLFVNASKTFYCTGGTCCLENLMQEQHVPGISDENNLVIELDEDVGFNSGWDYDKLYLIRFDYAYS